MGKARTYIFNEVGTAESLINERIIGHMHYGMDLVEKTFLEMPEVGQEFIDEVLHCIAAHHGRIEWGSYKEIQSVEAHILSSADHISSRFGMLEKKIKESIESGGIPEKEFRIYGDSFFINSGIKEYYEEQK